MPQPLPISASVEVAAAPEAVWAVVSDVTRMPEWSPELRRLFVIGSKEPRVGMNLVGHQPPQVRRLADHVEGRPLRARPRGRVEDA